jgi:hypothetical protein
VKQRVSASHSGPPWHQHPSDLRSDRILEGIHEKQQADAPLPHAPKRLAKDAEDFPQVAEDFAKGHAAWTDWPWKLHRIEGDTYELYNLETDPNETTDLASTANHQKRVALMKAELRGWMKSVVRSVNGEDY